MSLEHLAQLVLRRCSFVARQVLLMWPWSEMESNYRAPRGDFYWETTKYPLSHFERPKSSWWRLPTILGEDMETATLRWRYMDWELFLLETMSCTAISIYPRRFASSAVALADSGPRWIYSLRRNGVFWYVLLGKFSKYGLPKNRVVGDLL